MASIPHFYSNYQFSPDEFSEITSVMAQGNYSTATVSSTNINISSTATGANAMLGEDNNLPILFDNNRGVDIFSMDSDITSSVPVTSFPERLGINVSDMAVPTLMDYKLGSSTGIAKIQNFGGGFQFSDVREFGEDCCGLVPNFSPVCPAAGENWGIECSRMPAIEHTNIKVGRYTVEERKDRILRYLKKRNQRNFNKTIKYACRKTLADRRVRVRGRFARNNELFEEETDVKKNDDSPLQEKDSDCDAVVQIKNDDDDEWLQEAVASLMYVPYMAG